MKNDHRFIAFSVRLVGCMILKQLDPSPSRATGLIVKYHLVLAHEFKPKAREPKYLMDYNAWYTTRKRRITSTYKIWGQ